MTDAATKALRDVAEARAVLAVIAAAPFSISGLASIPCKPSVLAAMQAICRLEAIPTANGKYIIPA